ncbi:membrane dipeptidase [Candidatus Coxiella mudrowiae]|uniref:membrane dipeptidase n=1 Tax=Candidatus Coxiella mudrowiae TaxID=2054173 RepID=UPI000C283BF8|nr:membrane dipeptidase [Candidatus Coxiella mudrowiae]
MNPNSIHTYHVNYDSLQKGNVKALFLNVVGDYDLLKSLDMVDALYDLRVQYFEEVAIYTNFAEIIKAAEKGKLTFIFSVKGPCIFEGQVDLLKN